MTVYDVENKLLEIGCIKVDYPVVGTDKDLIMQFKFDTIYIVISLYDLSYKVYYGKDLIFNFCNSVVNGSGHNKTFITNNIEREQLGQILNFIREEKFKRILD